MGLFSLLPGVDALAQGVLKCIISTKQIKFLHIRLLTTKSNWALPRSVPHHNFHSCKYPLRYQSYLPPWHGFGLSAYTPRIFFRGAPVVLWGTAAVPSAF